MSSLFHGYCSQNFINFVYFFNKTTLPSLILHIDFCLYFTDFCSCGLSSHSEVQQWGNSAASQNVFLASEGSRLLSKGTLQVLTLQVNNAELLLLTFSPLSEILPGSGLISRDKLQTSLLYEFIKYFHVCSDLLHPHSTLTSVSNIPVKQLLCVVLLIPLPYFNPYENKGNLKVQDVISIIYFSVILSLWPSLIRKITLKQPVFIFFYQCFLLSISDIKPSSSAQFTRNMYSIL